MTMRGRWRAWPHCPSQPRTTVRPTPPHHRIAVGGLPFPLEGEGEEVRLLPHRRCRAQGGPTAFPMRTQRMEEAEAGGRMGFLLPSRCMGQAVGTPRPPPPLPPLTSPIPPPPPHGIRGMGGRRPPPPPLQKARRCPAQAAEKKIWPPRHFRHRCRPRRIRCPCRSRHFPSCSRLPWGCPSPPPPPRWAPCRPFMAALGRPCRLTKPPCGPPPPPPAPVVRRRP